MRNRAISSWQTVLRSLAAAADTGTLDTALWKAINDVSQLNSQQLPSAHFKKLVKQHKVALLVGKAFSASAQNPLSYDTFAFAAAAALEVFLLQAVHSMHKGQLPVPFSSPAAGSLAAEVSRQLQQSGVLQQLPRALTVAAQQLEACAADPAAPAAAWQLASEPGHWDAQSRSPQAHARVMLHILRLLLPLCDAQHARQLLAAAAAPAARTCLALLRLVSAAMQLYDPLCPTAESGISSLGHYSGVVQQYGVILLGSLHRCLNDPGVCEESWVQDTHLYQFNVVLAVAAALKLQYECSTASTGSSNSGEMAAGSSSSSSREAGSSSSNSAGTGQLAPEDPHRVCLAAAAAWQLSCEAISSLGNGPQLLLFEQLGLDPRVALWVICSYPTGVSFQQAVISTDVHNKLFSAQASTARQQWLQSGTQGQDEHQPGQQQQPTQQQQQEGQQQEHDGRQQQHDGRQKDREQQPSDWPLAFCLNLLLLSVVMPGRLTPEQMFTRMHDCTLVSMQAKLLGALTHLPEDTCAAVTAAASAAAASAAASAAAAAAAPPTAGMEAVPLEACLEELLHNLLLLSRNLAALIRHPATGSGTSSSSSAAGVVHSDSHAAGLADEVAAGTICVACMLSLILRACTKDLGPAAAFVVGQECEQGGQQQQQPQQQQQQQPPPQQQQQQSYVELLRPRLANIVAHFDSCVRVIAATKVSRDGPSTFCATSLGLGLSTCSEVVTGSIPAVLGQVSPSGFDSRVQRQLFSLQASLLKLSAAVKNSIGSSSSNSADGNEQRMLTARACTMGVAHLAASVVSLRHRAGAPTTAAAVDAAPAGPAEQQQQSAATTATELLPALVMFGRVCLQWAQELRQQAVEVQQKPQAGQSMLQLVAWSAAHVCCSGFWPLQHMMGVPGSDLAGINDLIQLLRVLQAWLGNPGVSAQLAAAGYNPQELLQQLELLSSAPAAAAAAATAAARQQPMTQVLQPLVEQLQVVGTALSSLAVPAFCNNPACSNVSGPTEVLLVSGRSCVCGGCLTARYCSRACLKQHWKAHKPVCQALAAAAAGAETASEAETAPVGAE